MNVNRNNRPTLTLPNNRRPKPSENEGGRKALKLATVNPPNLTTWFSQAALLANLLPSQTATEENRQRMIAALRLLPFPE